MLGTGAFCASGLEKLAHARWWGQSPQGIMPLATALVPLANLLINGRRCTSAPGPCSCCLAAASAGAASSAPVLSFRRSAQPLGPANRYTGTFLLNFMDGVTQIQLGGRKTEADTRLLASKGGALLQCQDVALNLLTARESLRTGGAQGAGRGRGGSSSGGGAGGSVSGSSNADLVPFLGALDGDAVAQLMNPPPGADKAARLLMRSEQLTISLAATLTKPSPAPCERCAPAQLLLAVEAATTFPEAAREQAAAQQRCAVAGGGRAGWRRAGLHAGSCLHSRCVQVPAGCGCVCTHPTSHAAAGPGRLSRAGAPGAPAAAGA
jgi:hypothetical protein